MFLIRNKIVVVCCFFIVRIFLRCCKDYYEDGGLCKCKLNVYFNFLVVCKKKLNIYYYFLVLGKLIVF